MIIIRGKTGAAPIGNGNLGCLAGGWSKIPIWIIDICALEIFLGHYDYSCRQRWTRRDSNRNHHYNGGGDCAAILRVQFSSLLAYLIAEISRDYSCCESVCHTIFIQIMDWAFKC